MAPELRAFVRAVLDEFEDEQRSRVIDSLLSRAARGDAGWKPNRPSSRIVNDARSFADAAQRVGPRWVKQLGRRRPSKDEWESDHERWLREAVFRLEGVTGLEQLARKTKRPQMCLAWCETLVDRRDWAGALHAYEASAALVDKSHWRGELLDGAALAAQQLKRSDVAERLAAAWHAAPTLARLLRWLVTEDRGPTALRVKARKIVSRCPKTAGRQLGLLRLLASDIRAAADLLSQAPGLGWSSDEHPGHVLFPSFALLLALRTSRSVPDALLADLDSTIGDPLEVLSPDDVELRPKLGTPSIVTLIQGVSSTIAFGEENLRLMVDSMCVAAERRVEGILGSSRRRQYGHAAMLVASCVALAPAGGGKDLSAWMMGLRQTYSRRHAFREELRRAMESLGVRD